MEELEKDINWEESDKKYFWEPVETFAMKTEKLLEQSKWNWIFTVWHSNHSIEFFLELIQSQWITFLLDIRSYAWSKYNPQFNKESLAKSLKDVWIEYAHAKVLWWVEWKDTDIKLFKATIERLIERSKEERVCIMCSEWDPYPNKYLPSWCHRFWKLSRYILDNYWENVFHLLKDLRVEHAVIEDYAKIDVNWEVIK